MQEITLPLHAGTFTVKARVYGAFAIHLNIKAITEDDSVLFGDEWVITHLGTGGGITHAIPAYERATLRQCQKLVKLLNQYYPDAAEQTNPRNKQFLTQLRNAVTQARRDAMVP